MCRNVLRTATGRRQLSLCNSSRSHHRLDRRCHDEAGVCRLFPLQRNRWRMCRNVPRTATGRRQLLPRRGGRDMLHSSVRTRFINRQRKRWMFQMDLRWVPWLLLSVLLTVEGQQQGILQCFCTQRGCVNSTCEVDAELGRCEVDLDVFPNNTLKEEVHYCVPDVHLVPCKPVSPQGLFTTYSHCCFTDDCNRCEYPASFPPQILPYLTVHEDCPTPTILLPSPSPSLSPSLVATTSSDLQSTAMPTSKTADTDQGGLKTYQVAIVALTGGVIILFTIMVLVIVWFCRHRLCCRLKQADSLSSLPQYPGLEGATLSGSGGGDHAILEARNIAKQIKRRELIGKGRFGEVWLGEWNGEDVAIKVFSPLDETSWIREQLIYKTDMLYHDNIVKFITGDKEVSIRGMELWMVMEYHHNGSLYDYLQNRTLSVNELLKLLISIATGLQYLHLDVTAGHTEKPGIAHRDLKSRNILVKADGSCCIADFGLAVRHNLSNGTVDRLPSNTRQGTKRYMAPEILDGTINASMFESYRMVDVYCLGLVFWEVARRCEVDGDMSEYELPYYDVVSQDPSFEEMRKVVVVDQRRPNMEARWKDDHTLSVLSSVMVECWRANPSARLNAFRIKKKLVQQRTEGKNGYNHYVYS